MLIEPHHALATSIFQPSGIETYLHYIFIPTQQYPVDALRIDRLKQLRFWNLYMLALQNGWTAGGPELLCATRYLRLDSSI